MMGKIMPEPVLQRRNSIASSVIPSKLNLSSNDHEKLSRFGVVNGERKVLHTVDDLELVSLLSRSKTNYTSLKDLMPSSLGIQSPRAVPGAETGYEICIKNRLVKQAAWAYLQPNTLVPGSSGRHFFERIWSRFSSEYLKNSFNACLEFLDGHVIQMIKRAFDRLFGLIWLGWNRRR
ncbi:hypothetical protein NE237_004308 [Protea cynaroides]|uniref:Uncharacterized protein n=1 Tax=Protea cynaroides TaxID=273540 RepID=A0A9Q0KIN7_9MAGN|nr:hypothetical protein NE237_004308 [Protea cynaroides]